ncbi:MAG: YraN family protein [Candidatus Ancillula sp.]|jgi:putative endonuclease|nr:YraN family protein [Candidatus Ancillula sp.]
MIEKNIAKIKKLPSRELGFWGESLAIEFLISEGHKIIDRNWYNSNLGELDIISEHNNQIVFTEVKTRRNIKTGQPFEAVTVSKYHQIYKLGQSWKKMHKINQVSRIDIIGITILDKIKIKYQPNFIAYKYY